MALAWNRTLFCELSERTFSSRQPVLLFCSPAWICSRLWSWLSSNPYIRFDLHRTGGLMDGTWQGWISWHTHVLMKSSTEWHLTVWWCYSTWVTAWKHAWSTLIRALLIRNERVWCCFMQYMAIKCRLATTFVHKPQQKISLSLCET